MTFGPTRHYNFIAKLLIGPAKVSGAAYGLALSAPTLSPLANLDEYAL
jgi:hypothetical protein